MSEQCDADLGISHTAISLSEIWAGERRLEGETYLSPGYTIRKQIENHSEYSEKVSKLAEVWQPPRLKGIQVREGDGVPFFTATQVFDIMPINRKWIAAKHTPKLKNRCVS